MKLFIDSAVLDEIREAASWGIIDGVTTNPSLLAKAGLSLKEAVKEICSIVDGPVSAEVVSEKAEDMFREGKEHAKIHKNVNVKVPMTSEGIKAVKLFSKAGIKTNVTLIFTPQQALLAAKAGATFVSPFVGRLDDIGQNGMEVVKDIMMVYRNYGFKTKVIVASVRNPEHVRLAALYGADIATIPFKVLKELFRHELTDKGIQRFLDDWKNSKK